MPKLQIKAFTVESARRSAREGKTAAWVQEFLQTEPKTNDALARALRSRDWPWSGPVQIALVELKRTVGPEKGMLVFEDPELWEEKIELLMQAIRSGAELPPLIVRADQGHYTITDGSHRHEAFRRLSVPACWTLVWHHS